MKRTKPSRREIARQLIAQHHQEEEARIVSELIRAAREAEANKPRIGPKTPKIIPYQENELFY